MKLNLKLSKWTGLVILLSLVIFIIIIYYTEVKSVREAKNNLLKHNTQITKIFSLENVRGWGENPEYSGIVKFNGERCRIWTSGNGVITENECEWNYDQGELRSLRE
ncbi:hypothetical protein [Paenibacillus prosopidis]|uniref:Uncharacterized protein n=1 Tax=Paenibacillus prosopidis TaxID=630520 RepID=A0A368VKQ5_9BACL|nr:hypothetical protein [Paenibacillus prosopidis]RCW40867.1 hypothetical protein DFP97_12922 [Paenibacillus prosopidis]